MQETWVPSLGREDSWRWEWQPTSVFLPRKFHGQRSLTGYSPWGCKELDTTEQLTLSFLITQAEENNAMQTDGREGKSQEVHAKDTLMEKLR